MSYSIQLSSLGKIKTSLQLFDNSLVDTINKINSGKISILQIGNVLSDAFTGLCKESEDKAGELAKGASNETDKAAIAMQAGPGGPALAAKIVGPGSSFLSFIQDIQIIVKILTKIIPSILLHFGLLIGCIVNKIVQFILEAIKWVMAQIMNFLTSIKEYFANLLTRMKNYVLDTIKQSIKDSLTTSLINERQALEDVNADANTPQETKDANNKRIQIINRSLAAIATSPLLKVSESASASVDVAKNQS